jgi:hypothetical protein
LRVKWLQIFLCIQCLHLPWVQAAGD